MSLEDQAPSDERPDPNVRVADARAPLRVDRSVVMEVARHVGGDTSVERGGVLVGSVETDGTVTIDGSIRAESAVSHASSLTFTHETWDEINLALERDHPDKRIVGWYHSHPGFSVFLSEYDTFIQRNFFSAPWQVAYVVDPLMGDDGFFGWVGDEIVRYPEWDVRAVAGQSGTAVDAPAPRPEGSPEPPTSANPGRLLVVALGAILAGIVVGLLLAPGPTTPAPRLSALATVRNDGLVLTRDLVLDDGCLEVSVQVINPTAADLPTLSVVDPLPTRLHNSPMCGGAGGIADVVSFDITGGLPSGQHIRGIRYSVELPEGVAEEASTLDELAAEHRAEWDALVSAPPSFEVVDILVEVGERSELIVGLRGADGSLLGADAMPEWTVDPSEVAVLDSGIVTGREPGSAHIVDEEGQRLARVQVVESAEGDEPNERQPEPETPVPGSD